ncbi:hypothetical protein AB9P05_23625 [Roseivirga sp. BDSF3-8]|uniref:hypothetical protein n=1 Tax=Roseivirga sp. BDSF3-8 TaxID=3241598 RepID=UPI003531A134
MERSNKPSDFEREWHDAFEGASRTPSPGVWEGIESSLDNKKSRKAAWVWWVAASLFLVVSVGGGVLLFNNGGGDQLATEQTMNSEQELLEPSHSPQADIDNAASDNKSGQGPQSGQINGSSLAQNNADQQTGIVHTSGDLASGAVENVVVETGDENRRLNASANQEDRIEAYQDEATHDPMETTTGSVYAFNEINKELLNSPASLTTKGPFLLPVNLQTVAITVYRVPDNTMFEKLEEERTVKSWEKEKLWTGLSFAGGSFDPSFNERPGAELPSVQFGKKGGGARLEEPDIDQEIQPTFSYDMNFNVAGMLGKHFVWQSGLSYQRMNATSNTTLVFQDVPSQLKYPILLSNADAPQSEGYKQIEWINTDTKTTNSFEFLTVPVKLGYVFGGEKVQFLLSSGISANFFLANTITSDNPSAYGSFETRRGDENNPFKSMTINGVLSGELLYRITPDFSISAGPMYQHSLDNLAEEGALFDSKPSSFLISTGIKYHIR